VRAPVIILLFFCALASPVRASAEAIHLKNGRTIWADHVREAGSRIEYDLGDNTYGIPKSLVDHIDNGVAPPSSASPNTADLPVIEPVASLKNSAALSDTVIRDGHVDDEALSSFDRANNAETAAAAYFIAGKHEFDHGNLPKARSYLDTALRYNGQDPTILNYYAALLIKTGNAAEAIPYAERAVREAPDSPDALTVLGYAQFAADRTQGAIRTWKHSLQLRPDTTVQQYLAKAERETSTEARFSEHETNHFTLHYEGEQTSDGLREQLVETLDSDYNDLVRELGISPHDSIPVVLYTQQAFFDVTQAPSWSGAVFDGKLRIPIQGLTSVTPELARVLKHELAHAFINQLSAGRCPQWLNEGIAQAVEPKMLSNGSRLAELYHSQREIPLNQLEGGFMRFSGLEANLAYEESLAAVQYIVDSYGMSDVQRILEQLGHGASTEVALRSVIHSDYGQLEGEVARYLNSKYGS